MHLNLGGYPPQLKNTVNLTDTQWIGAWTMTLAGMHYNWGKLLGFDGYPLKFAARATNLVGTH